MVDGCSKAPVNFLQIICVFPNIKQFPLTEAIKPGGNTQVDAGFTEQHACDSSQE